MSEIREEYKESKEAMIKDLRNEQGVLMTREAIEGYLGILEEKGRVQGTLDSYLRALNKLYEFLSDEKRIAAGTLEQWCKQMVEDKYDINTINSSLSAANGYLEFVGVREYQVVEKLKKDYIPPQPEMTRNEYLRLLSAAKHLKRDRTYFLVKLFANTEIPLKETEKVTVEAVTAGKVRVSIGRSTALVYIPKCICDELLAYAEREGIQSGPILLTKEGRPLGRTTISNKISYLASYANLPPEKCNPRCLKKMYQTSKEAIEKNIALVVAQAQERMLETEQLTTGWESDAF